MVSTMTVAPVLAEEEAATEEAAAEETTEEEAAEETTEKQQLKKPQKKKLQMMQPQQKILPPQFEGLVANEAYEFPMMVKSFQSTYWMQLRKV